ncbi:hypothetical protein RGR602_CH01308 [Rhizobium gallicum bv. gallicum R602sp]|uniref:Uncharacterized protein n=1 Tax=Rhizobium gallicum bv. gallicum R602sp TaxID=1041138 RepID=A0A0B4X1M9_9HYPH|nr:hypothetical protein RGR602_CH01308 [Rhizobium gallicum bv. gallicum R602sp]
MPLFCRFWRQKSRTNKKSREACKESIVTSKKTDQAEQAAKPDLSTHYRPLGLKAVLAAALMLKSKPALVKKIA